MSKRRFYRRNRLCKHGFSFFWGGDFGWIAAVKPQSPITELELTWIFIRFKGFTQYTQYISMASKILLHTNFHLHPLTARRMSHLSGIICITRRGSAIYYCFQLWKTGQKTQHLALFLECGCVNVHTLPCSHALNYCNPLALNSFSLHNNIL